MYLSSAACVEKDAQPRAKRKEEKEEREEKKKRRKSVLCQPLSASA
jgi:hypothetical protein